MQNRSNTVLCFVEVISVVVEFFVVEYYAELHESLVKLVISELVV